MESFPRLLFLVEFGPLSVIWSLILHIIVIALRRFVSVMGYDLSLLNFMLLLWIIPALKVWIIVVLAATIILIVPLFTIKWLVVVLLLVLDRWRSIIPWLIIVVAPTLVAFTLMLGRATK